MDPPQIQPQWTRIVPHEVSMINARHPVVPLRHQQRGHLKNMPAPINHLIQRRRSAFFGHVARLADNIPAKKSSRYRHQLQGRPTCSSGSWLEEAQRPPSIILGLTTWPA